MRVNVKEFDLDKLIIWAVGDNHLGSKAVDKELLENHVDWALNKENVYVIGMGDHLETATRDSVGAGVFEQSEIVEGQIDGFVELFKPLSDEGRLLGLHKGNHENRVYNHSGTNLTKILCKLLNTKYFGEGVVHKLKVGKNNYSLYTTHGGSGARLPHTKIKACIDLANMVDVEIYVMGHTHQLSHHVRQFYKLDMRNKMLVEGEKHFVLTGSYLNHWDSYALIKGYEMMRKGSPKIKLNGLDKRIKVSL